MFSLPGHFLLLTRHSLISEISGQGLPKGDGYCRTCRVRVSWPRLKPQVLPGREQGLHSLHSPTSQCTARGGGGVENEGWRTRSEGWETCSLQINTRLRSFVQANLPSVEPKPLGPYQRDRLKKPTRFWVVSFAQLTLWRALHEFVIGLVVLWTDMVAPPTELVQARPALCTCVTAHT